MTTLPWSSGLLQAPPHGFAGILWLNFRRRRVLPTRIPHPSAPPAVPHGPPMPPYVSPG